MITIKLSKNIKVQKYKDNGLKMNVKSNNGKWIIVKLSELETKLLKFAIQLLTNHET